MFLFYLSISIFIILICMVIKITLWQLGIKILTDKNKDNSSLALPAFISVLVQALIIFLVIIILKSFNLDIISVMYEKFMKFEYSKKEFFINILSYIIAIVAIVVSQAFVLSLTYDKKIFEIFKRNKKDVSKEIKDEDSKLPKDIVQDLEISSHIKSDDVYDVQLEYVDENEEFKKVFSFSNRIYTSIFEFVTIFIYIGFFLLVGFVLGPRIFL